MLTLESRSQKIKFSLYLIVVGVWGTGFVDLIRGGTTLSAFFLVIAYCIGVPLVIWFGGRRYGAAERPPNGSRAAGDRAEQPSYRVAGIVGLCVLALYLITMAPSTAMWDTSEYIAAAYTF